MGDKDIFAIEFAEFIGKNGFILVDTNEGVCYWENETDLFTTEQLLEIYK